MILGTIIGAVLGQSLRRASFAQTLKHSAGLVFSFLMKFTERKGFIDRESYVAQYLATALFTIGITRTLGVDDLLAAYAAGPSFFFLT